MDKDFSHLFPPTTEDVGAIPVFTDPCTTPENGIDYVILFRFPLQDQANVTLHLKQIMNRLTHAHLRFLPKLGKEEGTLILLVNCPIQLVRQRSKRQRAQDFLLGHRINNEAEAISEAERLRLVYDILTSPESEGGAGITKSDKYIDTIMPLHNDKQIESWIQSLPSRWFMTDQDLMTLRNYFGEKVTFYFAFLYFYSMGLTLPAALGVAVMTGRISNIGFSILILVWGVLMIECWRRKESRLAVQWGVRGSSEESVLDWMGITRRLLTIPAVLLGAVCLTGVIGLVFFIQVFLHEFYSGPFHKVLYYMPTLGYVLFIPKIIQFYTQWIKVLTRWEIHSTESSWESSYTKKVFIANFLVSYLSLFITGWVVIPFSQYLSPYLTHLGVNHTRPAIDFLQLRSQLVYFVVTGQLIGFATEMILPYLVQRYQLEKKAWFSKPKESPKDWMEKIHHQLQLSEHDLYHEYVEMVIQFGYVTLFSTVWSLTPLCCLFNNWFEFRGDLIKLWKFKRRPIPSRAESIGPWLGHLETLVWLSSVTMSSFSYLYHPFTDFSSPSTVFYTILAVLLAEHLYMAVRVGIRHLAELVPAQSELWVRQQDQKIRKEWLQEMLGDQLQFINKK